MSTNHTRDDWADPRVGEKLQRALDGLAGQAATASGIGDALGSVRTRVRRRRAAKKAGIGVTTLAVAGGLTIGGAALLPDQPLVVPPATTPSPTETVDPTPTDPTPSEPTPADTEPTEPTEPEPSDTGEPAPDDCTATELDVDEPDLSVLPAPVQDTAARLLDAALDCDDETLVAMSTEDNTFLSYGGTAGAEFWTLPDAEQYEDVYAKLALLITQTQWVAEPPSDQGPYAYTWPRVHSLEWSESDEAWREVVDAGVVSEEYAEEMRLIHGQYLGYRLGIHEDGTWQFFLAGD
jgi:hypothetical protein